MSNIWVKEESEERLHLLIEPTAVTWGVAIGLLSFIVGYPLYSYENIGLIVVLWLLGTFGILAFFNPWQEVVLDRESCTLVIERQNFYQRYHFKTSSPSSFGVDTILTVKYESPNIVFTRDKNPKVEVIVKGDTAAILALVEKMQDIIQYCHQRRPSVVVTPLSVTPLSETGGSVQSEAANEDSSSATSDDSFERIEPADLAEYESPKQDAEVNDIPSDAIESLSPTLEEPEAPTFEEEPEAPTIEEEPEALTTEPKEEELAATELSSASSDEPRPKSGGDVVADPVGATAGQSQ